MDIALLKEFGVTGIILYAAYLVVSKLYSDMRNDSGLREQKLMEYMEKQSDTMRDISDTLKTMDNRICSLEKCFNHTESEMVKQ